MLTVGLVALDAGQLDYVPSSSDSWKLLQLAAKRGRLPDRVLSDPKLDAVAFLGSNVKKLRLAGRAVLRGKHVLVDFPASRTVESARKLEATAAARGVIVYSPNLLKHEPGFQELKRISNNSSSKMLSLTMTCGVKSRFTNPEFSMKLAQLFDMMEWVGNSQIKDVRVEKSAKRSSTAALVALGAFENGLKAMLNVYSAPTSMHSRLWVDAVFNDSFVHVDPYAQSIRITRFQGESMTGVNWATSGLVSVIEDFAARIDSEKHSLDLVNLDRMLKLACSVVHG